MGEPRSTSMRPTATARRGAASGARSLACGGRCETPTTVGSHHATARAITIARRLESDDSGLSQIPSRPLHTPQRSGCFLHEQKKLKHREGARISPRRADSFERLAPQHNRPRSPLQCASWRINFLSLGATHAPVRRIDERVRAGSASAATLLWEKVPTSLRTRDDKPSLETPCATRS